MQWHVIDFSRLGGMSNMDHETDLIDIDPGRYEANFTEAVDKVNNFILNHYHATCPIKTGDGIVINLFREHRAKSKILGAITGVMQFLKTHNIRAELLCTISEMSIGCDITEYKGVPIIKMPYSMGIYTGHKHRGIATDTTAWDPDLPDILYFPGKPNRVTRIVMLDILTKTRPLDKHIKYSLLIPEPDSMLEYWKNHLLPERHKHPHFEKLTSNEYKTLLVALTKDFDVARTDQLGKKLITRTNTGVEQTSEVIKGSFSGSFSGYKHGPETYDSVSLRVLFETKPFCWTEKCYSAIVNKRPFINFNNHLLEFTQSNTVHDKSHYTPFQSKHYYEGSVSDKLVNTALHDIYDDMYTNPVITREKIDHNYHTMLTEAAHYEKKLIQIMGYDNYMQAYGYIYHLDHGYLN